MVTEQDCLPDSHNADYTNKLIIVKAEALQPEYRTAEHQYVLCTHGNGARPDAFGTSVFGKELFSGDTVCYGRHQIEGVANPEKLPKWAQVKMESAHQVRPLSTMSELKQRVYTYELSKIGFTNTEYLPDTGKLKIQADNDRMPEINDKGHMLYGLEYAQLAIDTIGPLVNNVNEMLAAWENARPMCLEKLSNYNVLAEYNNTVLAARDDTEYGRGLYFVTWQGSDRTELCAGYYTEDFTNAKESFALRSGLVQQERMIPKEQSVDKPFASEPTPQKPTLQAKLDDAKQKAAVQGDKPVKHKPMEVE